MIGDVWLEEGAEWTYIIVENENNEYYYVAEVTGDGTMYDYFTGELYRKTHYIEKAPKWIADCFKVLE